MSYPNSSSWNSIRGCFQRWLATLVLCSPSCVAPPIEIRSSEPVVVPPRFPLSPASVRSYFLPLSRGSVCSSPTRFSRQARIHLSFELGHLVSVGVSQPTQQRTAKRGREYCGGSVNTHKPPSSSGKEGQRTPSWNPYPLPS